MKRILIACGALLSLVALAQAPAQPALALAPVPLMETIRGEQPIELRSLHIDVQARGGLAETTVRMEFYNPNPRQLEGNLVFPLLDGQQVSGFALDFDGKMRPAVPVPKSRGRQVFEDVERRSVDPALLERTQGNNFRLRVYPVPARGTRTVELRYSEALVNAAGQRRYRLPLAYAGKLADFRLSIASDAPGRPRATGAIGGLDFTRSDGLYRAEVSRLAFAPGGTLELLLPTPKQAQVSVQARGDELYFLAEVPVSTARHPRKLPHRIGLLWDSSMSGEARPHAAELALLDRYFRAWGNGEVQLVRLRDRAEPARRFLVRDGDWSALRHELEATTYDGASALADWKPEAGIGEYLLFSDGLLNYGPLAFADLHGPRLYAINASASADRERLRAVAEASGGELVELEGMRIEAAAQQLLGDAAGVEVLQARGLADLQRAPNASSDGFVRIAGRLTAPDAELTLRLSDGSTRRVAISDRSPVNPFAAQQWANYRLAALAGRPELKRAEIARLGTRFGIPTSETSLIVLESVEDYAKYEITPPAELADAYAKLRGERDVQMANSRRDHLESVAQAFARRVAWWNTDFPKGAPPEAKKQIAERANGGDLSRVAVIGSAMPAPAAPAPAMEAMAAPAADAAATRAEDGLVGPSPAATIAIKQWQSDAPYVARLRAAKPQDIYAIYLDERPTWRSSTGFYVDVADLLFERGQRDLALRVLSNLAEMDLDNRHILRVLGYRLVQAKAAALAVPVFEKVANLADYEPQSFRDLGNALAAAGRGQEAIDALYEVVARDWQDNRFAEIELVALAELNAVAATSPVPLDLGRVDARLRRNLPLDLRVVLSWDADNSDMDLWVTDPNGEKCFYGHRDTYQGGHNSDDFTGGYGPEEFSLRVAKPGRYKVEANYFGDRQQAVTGPTTLTMRFTTKFGTRSAQEQVVMLRLKDKAETVLVGEFVVE